MEFRNCNETESVPAIPEFPGIPFLGHSRLRRNSDAGWELELTNSGIVGTGSGGGTGSAMFNIAE